MSFISEIFSANIKSQKNSKNFKKVEVVAVNKDDARDHLKNNFFKHKDLKKK